MTNYVISIKFGNRFFEIFENSIDSQPEIVTSLNQFMLFSMILDAKCDASLLQLYNLALFPHKSFFFHFGFLFHRKKIAVGFLFSTAYYYEILIR